MTEYDIVVVADLRDGSPDAEDVARALADWVASGCRAALVQLSSRTRDALAPLAIGIRAQIDRGKARLVLPHEDVRAPIAIIWRPEHLQHQALPAVETQQVVVVTGDEQARAQRAPHEATLVRQVFGVEPDFAAVPPAATEIAGRRARSDVSERVARPATGDGHTVLMVSSNGTGMGHLTRLLAYSRRAPEGVHPQFMSMSQAVPVVGDFGFQFEYVPSVAATGMSPVRWRTYLARRLGEAFERHNPAVVVFDGAWAYESLADVREMYSNVRWVWSRRGMWYRGMNRDQLAKAAWFDAVLEPGDFAAPADRGVTAAAPAVRVGPVTLLDHEDLLSRADARAALGLDASAPTALVTLGAGNINDPSSDVQIVINALRALGMEVCVTVPAIAERANTDDEHVHLVKTFPLARYLHAFDVAVSAAGYNSFHELLRFGVPTLFLPNLQTSLDDQRTRARFAADRGWAHYFDKSEPASIVTRTLEALLEHGDGMVAKVAQVDPGNGATEAMDLIAGYIRGGA